MYVEAYIVILDDVPIYENTLYTQRGSHLINDRALVLLGQTDFLRFHS